MTTASEAAQENTKLSVIWLICSEVEKLVRFCHVHDVAATAKVVDGFIQFEAHIKRI